MHLVHIITGTDAGGAEGALLQLVQVSERHGTKSTVVCIRPLGSLASRYEAAGAHIYSLQVTGPRTALLAIFRLVRLLRSWKPDIVQTWMYHADLMGGLAARLAGIPVVWGLRHSDLAKEASRPRTRAVARCCARLSHWVPSAVVSCAYSSRDLHVEMGYDHRKMRVIHNGIAVPPEVPPAGCEPARTQLGISWQGTVVGRAGRWHAQKDYPTFFEAARILLAKDPGVAVACCGPGMDTDNAPLMELCADLVRSGRVFLLGELSRMDRFYTGIDVLVSSSSGGEAFPNVLAEGLAYGSPVVATDVGDSRIIVGPGGLIVPPGSPDELVNALLDLLEEQRTGQSSRATLGRRHVEQSFSVESMYANYAELYGQVLSTGTA